MSDNQQSNGHYRVDIRFLRGPWARRVGPYGIAVYSILVSFAGNESREAWPSLQTIADMAGCSRRTVINSIADLEDLNLIRRRRQRAGQGWSSNRYTILPPEQWRQPEDGRPQGSPLREGECPAPDRAARTPARSEPAAQHRAAGTPNRAAPSLTSSEPAAHELTSLSLTNIPCSDEHGPAPPVKALKKRQTKGKAPPLEIYRTVTGRYPPRASEPLILATNISSEADLAFWQQVIRHWIACGWSPQNLKGMLDYYQQRRLPSTRPAGGYSLRRGKGAHYDIYTEESGGYRFATLADFGLPDEPEQNG